MGKKKAARITITFRREPDAKEIQARVAAKKKEIQDFHDMKNRLRPDGVQKSLDYQKGWVNGIPPKKTFY